ncbi:uncharacterized protein LOC116426878 [Nomia melanderi]|uniref:uncharacterized protein LOC116426878 n=1 Tax=Nomia melanderi TaxID=2448451 RepID=UPI003FCD4CA8
MMENVYVIKVKTKPPISSLYPSERRYSASTVGGLSFVHFGLGALSLLLGSLNVSLQGPILSAACLVPFVTGVLAWRRWYIDRNIAIFFYGSLFSLIAAVLCFISMVFDIATAVGNSGGSVWSLAEILDQPRDPSHLEKHLTNKTLLNETASIDEETFNATSVYDQLHNVNFNDPTPGIVLDNMSNISGYILRASTSSPGGFDSEIPGEMSVNDTVSGKGSPMASKGNMQEDSGNVTDESVLTIKNRVVSIWSKHYQNLSHADIFLTVNVLVASLFEAFWSTLSARIALRGMMNRLPESSYANHVTGRESSEHTGLGKRKSPAPRPCVLDHDRRLSESLQNLSALHGLRNPGPRLPLPESSREFRERVERFLANQAAHRVVEGSCS